MSFQYAGCITVDILTKTDALTTTANHPPSS